MSRRASVACAIARLSVAGICTIGDAHAETLDDHDAIARASPDAPVFAYGGRGSRAALGDWAMRASVGATLSVLPATSDLFVTLVPFIELADDRGQLYLFPNQTWRGRFTVAVGARVSPSTSVAIAFEHESDHSSTRDGSVDAVLHAQSIVARVRHEWALFSGTISAGTDARLFVGTCTRIDAECHGVSGTATFGASAEVSYDGDPQRKGWGLIAGIDGWLVAANDPAIGERRVNAIVGVARAGATGRWAAIASAWIGNDVGIVRAEEVTGLGVSVRWGL